MKKRAAEHDEFADIRTGVRALCAKFPGEYWRGLDRERAYPTEFVAALTEASRVLRAGGRLLICDMLPHDRETYRQQMGHVWLGFSEDALQKMLATAGFDNVRITAMPADPDAKGPALFVAAARRRGILNAEIKQDP